MKNSAEEIALDQLYDALRRVLDLRKQAAVEFALDVSLALANFYSDDAFGGGKITHTKSALGRLKSLRAKISKLEDGVRRASEAQDAEAHMH